MIAFFFISLLTSSIVSNCIFFGNVFEYPMVFYLPLNTNNLELLNIPEFDSFSAMI